ncbi:MAG TPA: glutathione S-transferase family protein [Vitreimonas sp.]|uniref:glutathione S-transferase family protein n=1 Tax=Vitreimonas sp. TaxID=3069702 RepID=UPI002D2DDE6B|nr:glutathione S-transferase family protein [Vitreimonas sp.]HYD89657.1 glutathione S-transferase family protein [Vitreimonas sp.]
MSAVRLYGFPLSTYVNVARLVLTHKGVPYDFHDLEPDMGGPRHLALHPFNRVPILEHGDFLLYETAAIIAYVDDAFPGPKLTPSDLKLRARMNQWISNLSAYYYPYIAFHLGHERIVYPALGVAPDEKVVAAALPRIRTALDVMERELQHGREFLITSEPTLADYALLPCMTTLSMTPEGADMLMSRNLIMRWRSRMEALPAAIHVRAEVAPHVAMPVEHARTWVNSHRPYYR